MQSERICDSCISVILPDDAVKEREKDDIFKAFTVCWSLLLKFSFHQNKRGGYKKKEGNKLNGKAYIIKSTI